jgi:septal ring-binding cell division protein DamX
MPRDYANKGSHKSGRSVSKKPVSKKKPSKKTTSSKKKETTKPRFPFRALVLILLLIIIVLLVISYLHLNYSHNLLEDNTSQNSTGPQVVTIQPVKLNNQTAVVTNAPLAARSGSPLPQATFRFQSASSSSMSSGLYFLQLGTYQKGQLLDQLRSRLRKQKVPYKTKQFTRLGQTYYRLQKGPYSSEQDALTEQATLQSKKIFSVLVS